MSCVGGQASSQAVTTGELTRARGKMCGEHRTRGVGPRDPASGCARPKISSGMGETTQISTKFCAKLCCWLYHCLVHQMGKLPLKFTRPKPYLTYSCFLLFVLFVCFTFLLVVILNYLQTLRNFNKMLPFQ